MPRRLDRAFILFVLTFFAVWTARATVFYSLDLSLAAGAQRLAYQAGLKLALWVLPPWVYLRLRGERSPGRALKLTTPLTRRAAASAAIGVSLVLADVALSRWLFQPNPAPAPWPRWPGLLLWGAVVVLFEEILFRGFVLQQLAARMRFWPANLWTAGLFMLAHVPNWLWTRGPGLPVLLDLAGVFALGCLFGYVVARSDSLWPGVATHLANNFLVAVL